jgi:Mg-chelatase subunit ChlI
MRCRTNIVYSFCAIIGQEEMKMALVFNVINPKIDGVLLRDEKGKAESLGVRALAHLLPEAKVVADYPLYCDPAHPKEICDACGAKVANGVKLPVAKRPVSVVELPIGATKDITVSTFGI